MRIATSVQMQKTPSVQDEFCEDGQQPALHPGSFQLCFAASLQVSKGVIRHKCNCRNKHRHKTARLQKRIYRGCAWANAALHFPGITEMHTCVCVALGGSANAEQCNCVLAGFSEVCFECVGRRGPGLRA
jgi:hypothetical protein